MLFIYIQMAFIVVIVSYASTSRRCWRWTQVVPSLWKVKTVDSQGFILLILLASFLAACRPLIFFGWYLFERSLQGSL